MAQAMTVILAEDDEDHRAVLADALEYEGYAVVAAKDGAEALALLQPRERRCLVLADLHMPAIDGRELIARMKSDSELAAIPVVIMTGSTRIQTGPIQGAKAVLEKPFSLEALLTVISEQFPAE